MHDNIHIRNHHAILPTPERLDAHPTLTGRGIVLALVDTAFHPHPDLVQPLNRILAYHDVTGSHVDLGRNPSAEAAPWLGMQASVVAAGSGFLSNGAYRGLASRADLVLVKVGDESGASIQNLAAGLEWLADNHERLGVRVVCVCVSDAHDTPSAADPDARTELNALVDGLVESGVVVVAAMGTVGCAHQHEPSPPATATSAITVGGYDDHNEFGHCESGLYCSSYGMDENGTMKPEVVGPSARLAAPLLPGTRQFQIAEALSLLAATPDYRLRNMAHEHRHLAELPAAVLDGSLEFLREYVEDQVAQRGIVSMHYQSSDGAVFSAPIVASLVAQMLESNSLLDPMTVKRILIQTADRIDGPSIARQGFGRVNARRAIEYARRLTRLPQPDALVAPHIVGDRLVFSFHDPRPSAVGVAGDFTDWKVEPMTRTERGTWRHERPSLREGRYRYKFVLDDRRWIPDPSNDLDDDDGYGGFNSVVNVRGMYDIEE